MNALLQVQDLTIDYQDGNGSRTHALRGASFDIGRGEVLGILGESGCGKTTLALALARLLPQTARIVRGEVLYRGTDLMKISGPGMDALRGVEISMIFQEPSLALNPVMSAGTHLMEVIRAHRSAGGRRCREEAEAWLARVRLDDIPRIFRAYPHELSGGQSRRLLIALALARQPGLVIADEPTVGLDARTKAEILDLVAALSEDSRTAFLCISHDHGVLARLAGRVLVMRAGRIEGEVDLARVCHPPHRNIDGLMHPLPSLEKIGKEGKTSSYEPGTDILVRTSNLTKWYDGHRSVLGTVPRVQALRHVDIEIPAGSTLAVVGASGAGKSTLARCLARLEEADAGEIWFDGRNLAELRGDDPFRLRREIQMVFQDSASALNPRMTCRQVVEEPLVVQRMGEAQDRTRRARELIARVGLPLSCTDASPMHLSGGQRQRLAIARALALGPRFLIFDEAFAGLDPSTMVRLADLLLDLQRTESLTYLFISHDLNLVSCIADEAVVMDAGRVVERVSASRLIQEGQHPQTRRLVEAESWTL